MHVLNAAKSSEYFDSLVDECEDSAVSAIHGAWLEHSSSLGRVRDLDPTSPLDMLVLYQAAAATFRDWTPDTATLEELSPGGRVVNREQAMQKLQSITDPELAGLATRFANQVITLSDHAEAEQDLNYFVELFLRCLHDRRMIDGIMSGAISRHSKQLADPDFW
jgi:hypothetical protein